MKKVLSILCCIAFLTGMCPPLNLLAIETPKPVAYYNFNDANTLGYDLTGNGNTLEAFGSPTQTVNGKTGSGLLLDGHSSLYATTDTSGLDFVDKIDKAQGGSGQITIGYWLKTTKGDFLSPDWRRTVDNGSNGGLGYGGFSMLSLIDNIQSPNLYNPVINIDTADSSKISQGNWSTYAYTEEWHYLTWTFDAVNSVSAFYVNGTAIFYNDYTYTSKLSNANALFSIGAQTISAAFDNNMRLVQPFKGMIDELSVFDTVLSQEDISHYMVQGFTTPGETTYQAPVAYYNFNDANTLGYDLTGNGNTLEAFGSPTQTANGKAGSGLLLDGHSSLYATTDTSGLDFVDKIDKAQGGSGQITIGYWLKTTKGDFLSPDWRRTVDNGSNGGLGYGGFSMLSLIDNIQSPTLYNPVINIDTADSSKISQGNWSTYAYTEEWHYLTWTFDAVNSVSAFYVNGTAIFYNDYTYTSKLSNANALFSIGAQTISAAFDNNMRLVQPFKGMIDELSVFDSVLTQDEISHYMVQGFSPDAGGEHQVYISTDSGCTATKTITDNVVTINAVPNDDYVLSTMYYITDGKQSARIENSSFIMPDDNVTVYVTSDNIKNPSYNNLFTSQKDATHYYQNKLLLVGGNAISEWKTSDDELLPMESVNLGINGITTAFCKNNIDAYKAFNPSAILINLGDDDITGKGFVSKTGTQTGELLKAYLTALKQNINVPIYFVSILPSRDSFRFSASSETVAANQIVKGFCESNEGFTYIDVSSKLLIEGTDTDGKPLATLFLDNGYTLSKKGYEIWTNTIRGALSISGEAPKNPSVNKSIYRFTGIDANLLAHYEFEDEKNPGKDSSYNKNDLSYYTMNEDLEYVKTTSAFPLTNSKEGFGKAASFDSYSFLSASNNKDKVDFTDKAKNLTISYLIKNRTLINDEVALANGWMVVLSNGGNYHNGWSLNCSFDNSSTSNNFSMFKKTTGEINIANPAAGTANATDWNRITFTIDNDTKTACAYINGTLFQKDISNLNYSMSEIISNFAIGAYVVSDEKGNQMILPSTFGFCGYLDDILVFDGALSAFQIAQIENINFTPPSLESGSNTLVNKNKLYVSDSSKTYTDLYKMYSFDDNTYIAFYNAEGSLITDLSSIITEGSIITAKRQNITVNRLAITRNPAGNAATSDEIILYAHLSVMIVMALIFLIFARKPSINQNNSI